MAFLTNSVWKVEPAASDGHPRGLFLPRSQIVVAQHVLEDLHDNEYLPNLPPGGLVFDKKLRRSYEHSYNFVRVSNGRDPDEDPDAIVVTAGDPTYDQDALELELRLLESPGYARIIAQSLVRYYGGFVEVPEEPSINLRYKLGGGGSTTVIHVVVAADANGRLLGRSNVVLRYDGLNQQQIFWEVSALGGAPVFARIYRVSGSTTAGGYGFLTQVPWANGTFVDVFTASADGSLVPTLDILQPRQAGEVIVLDDGRLYSPGDEVKVVDLYRTPDPDDPWLPISFTVEQVDVEPADDLVKLTVFQKEIA
jgi:hypothetical protein